MSEQTETPTNASFDEIVSEVNRLKEITKSIPALAKMEPGSMQKAWKNLPTENPARGPKAAFFDPLSLQYAMGYKDRRYSLTYQMLRRISQQLSVVGAIINTRIAQVASFSQPYRQTKSLGFVIKHKNPEHETTRSERRFIRQLETFITNCGEPGKYNPYVRFERDDFETFLKKIVRDTLTYDQVAFEIVPRINQIPFEFWAVDASTIRIASTTKDIGSHWSYHQRQTANPMLGYRFQGLYQNQQYGSRDMLLGDLPVQYVQVVNGQIENVYTRDELAFGIRNPRTDIYIQGYGYGELEQLVTIVTALLYAEDYNRRYFTNGAHPKGLLNFKGDNWTPDQLEAFKRQWAQQIQGTENAWKTPITQSEGLEWVNLQMNNKDMEFSVWVEYLLKLTCGCYLIDPAEINFDLHGGVQQTPLFESSQEWKLKASRDRGLRPLLRFIAKLINRHIIDKIDDHFVFEFAGLDELSEQEKHEMLKEQIGSYLTLNEGRRSLDLPDIEGGDIPMNPVYIQAMQMKAQQDQMAQMQGGGEGGDEEDQGDQQDYDQSYGYDQGDEEVPEGSIYSANYGKSFNKSQAKKKKPRREIVVKFDDWIDEKRSVN